MQKNRIIWIGISMQKDSKKAFDEKFLSGKILARIQEGLGGFVHYYENLVDFAPLNENGKLRYPNVLEIAEGRARLLKVLEEVNPSAIFTLGSLVTKSMGKALEVDLDFPKSIDYKKTFARWSIIPIHHPAYIGVYKRKEIDKYISEIKRVVCGELFKCEINSKISIKSISG